MCYDIHSVFCYMVIKHHVPKRYGDTRIYVYTILVFECVYTYTVKLKNIRSTHDVLIG